MAPLSWSSCRGPFQRGENGAASDGSTEVWFLSNRTVPDRLPPTTRLQLIRPGGPPSAACPPLTGPDRGQQGPPSANRLSHHNRHMRVSEPRQNSETKRCFISKRKARKLKPETPASHSWAGPNEDGVSIESVARQAWRFRTICNDKHWQFLACQPGAHTGLHHAPQLSSPRCPRCPACGRKIHQACLIHTVLEAQWTLNALKRSADAVSGS